MLCAAVRTVHGCGLYVQSRGKLSRAVLDKKLQPLRASCTRSGPSRATVSVDACSMYTGACLERSYLRACRCAGEGQAQCECRSCDSVRRFEKQTITKLARNRGRKERWEEWLHNQLRYQLRCEPLGHLGVY